MKRTLIVGFSLLALAGCKIAVTVPEGGRVITTSGAMECNAGRTCEIDVADTHFKETFRAVANSGWEFAGWKEDLLCGGTKTDCTISTQNWDYSNPGVRALLSDQTLVYRLNPEFRRVALQPQYPNVAGRYYQQIDSFWLDCAYPIGSLWADRDYSYVTISQKGKDLTLKSDEAPDPSVKYSKRWDGKISIERSGKFYEVIEESYVLKTVDGKIRVNESSQFSGKISSGGYQATRISQANLVPQYGPYKGQSFRCTTGAVQISADRI